MIEKLRGIQSRNQGGVVQAQAKKAGAVAGYLTAFVLIVSLFLMWGVANNLNDILIKQFKKTFLLSDFQSGLVQSAFYLGYFLFAIPAALFMRRFGYKGGVICGLLLFAIGAFLFYPAAMAREYGYFLAALFVIASGLSFLETAANPLVTVLGPPETAERRLNFAQAFNPVGSILGIYVGREFIFSGIEHEDATLAAMTPAARDAYLASEAHAVILPYLVIGAVVVVWALAVALTRFPPVAESNGEQGEDKAGFAPLLKFPLFMGGVAAQFFYVGAQVGIWSYLIRYAQDVVPGMPEKTAADYLMYSLVAFMIGRFVGTALMTRIGAATLMVAYSAISIALMGVAVAMPGMIGLWALVASSFFMSIMFPSIFALSLRGLGPYTKSGSSLLVMAIIGGALLPLAMGWLSDVESMPVGYAAPAVCFVMVLVFAFSAMRQRASA